MKLLSLLFAISLPAFASEAPRFSAFSVGDELYVTVLADTCNSHGAGLNVDPICREDRETRNLAPTCSANLVVRSTRKFCPDRKRVPTVMTISLTKSKVAREASLLELTYGGKTVEVMLDRE